MTFDLKSFLGSKAPARPSLVKLTAAMLTSAAALLALVGIGMATGQVLLIPSMAASMALIAGAPSLPLSQPRNVVGGQLISAVVGVAVGLVSHSPWAAAVAGALALGVMLLARMSHSPAAAMAVIGAMAAEGRLAFVACVGLAAVVLVLFGLLRATFRRTAYPSYWW